MPTEDSTPEAAKPLKLQFPSLTPVENQKILQSYQFCWDVILLTFQS